MNKASFILVISLLISCSSNTEQAGTEFIDSTELATDEAYKVNDNGSSDSPEAIPPDGEYRFDIAFAEWEGKSMGEKVTVVIQGDSIKVTYEGDGTLTAEKGEVLDEGVILKHKSGDWIIAQAKGDVNLEEVGGCTGGPSVIDFKNKKYWMC